MDKQARQKLDARWDKGLAALNWALTAWYEDLRVFGTAEPAWVRVMPILNVLPYIAPRKADVTDARRAVTEMWHAVKGPGNLWEVTATGTDHVYLDDAASLLFLAWKMRVGDQAFRYEENLDALDTTLVLAARQDAARQGYVAQETLQAGAEGTALVGEVVMYVGADAPLGSGRNPVVGKVLAVNVWQGTVGGYEVRLVGGQEKTWGIGDTRRFPENWGVEAPA